MSVRTLIAEAIAAGLLVFLAIGAAVIGVAAMVGVDGVPPGTVAIAASLAAGLVLLGILTAVGPFRRRHFSPGISLGLLRRRVVPSAVAADAWIGQLIGIVLAGGGLYLFIPWATEFNATLTSPVASGQSPVFALQDVAIAGALSVVLLALPLLGFALAAMFAPARRIMLVEASVPAARTSPIIEPAPAEASVSESGPRSVPVPAPVNGAKPAVSPVAQPVPEVTPFVEAIIAPEPVPWSQPVPEPVVAREPEPDPEPVVAREPEPDPEPVVAREPVREPLVARHAPVTANYPRSEPMPSRMAPPRVANGRAPAPATRVAHALPVTPSNGIPTSMPSAVSRLLAEAAPISVTNGGAIDTKSKKDKKDKKDKKRADATITIRVRVRGQKKKRKKGGKKRTDALPVE